jgi:hypothetical protein
MFFHIRIFLYSLIFLFITKFISSSFVGETISSASSKKLWLIGFLFLVLLVYFYQIARRLSQRVSMTPLPVVFVLSTWGLLFFVQSYKQQYLLIGLSAIAYYFIHISLYRLRSCYTDKTARGIIAAGSIATIFLFYAMAFGVYLNFNITLWAFMSLLILVTALISFQYFWLINENKKNVLNYSLILGLIMAEIVWVLNFWPFGYLTTGVITLIFYYVFWDLIGHYFLDVLTKKRILFNLIFFGILVILVLSSARWLPVV